MEVRLARPADAPQIAVVHVLSWQQAYRGLLPEEYLDGLDPAQRVGTWQQAIRQPDSLRSATMVIASNEAIDGFVNVGPTRDAGEDPERVGEVRAIYLLPTAWGKGFGRRLMDAALLRLADAGFAEATLWVLDTNARARRFYEAGGWSADGAVKEDARHGFPLTEVRYRKPLL